MSETSSSLMSWSNVYHQLLQWPFILMTDKFKKSIEVAFNCKNYYFSWKTEYCTSRTQNYKRYIHNLIIYPGNFNLCLTFVLCLVMKSWRSTSRNGLEMLHIHKKKSIPGSEGSFLFSIGRKKTIPACIEFLWYCRL